MAHRGSALPHRRGRALALAAMLAPSWAQPVTAGPGSGGARAGPGPLNCEQGIDCCPYLQIPPLAGMSYLAAAARLRQLGAKPRRTEGRRAGASPDVVYGTLPLTDERVCIDTQVWLFVGPPRPPIALPPPGPKPSEPEPAKPLVTPPCREAACAEPAGGPSTLALVSGLGTAAIGGGLVASRLLRSGQGGPAPLPQEASTQAAARMRFRIKRDVGA